MSGKQSVVRRVVGWGKLASAIAGPPAILRATGRFLLVGPTLLRAALLFAITTRTLIAEEPQAFPPDEPSFPARLIKIDREWNLSFRANGKIRVVAAKELAYWGQYRDVEMGPQILLTDGGLIRADLLALSERELTMGDATGLGRGLWVESSLPRQAVRAIVWQPPAATLERDKLLLRLQADRGVEDRLLLVGGESLVGSLIAAPRVDRLAAENQTPDAFQIVRRGTAEPLTIPAAKVMAVVFGGGGQPRPTSAPAAWLGFSDGSYLLVTTISPKSGDLILKLAAGGELRANLAAHDESETESWDAITYIQPLQARINWLSSREPISYKHIPFLSVQRSFGRDESILGTRLRASGVVFSTGLGMPTASRLAYDVAGYHKFQAEIALDDAAGLKGSVVFKVWLEDRNSQWQPAYESPVLRGGDPPVSVSVDLKGAARMALLVDFADRGDECDYADWLMARLVR